MNTTQATEQPERTTGEFENMTSEEYFANYKQFVSASTLKRFRRSPVEYQWWRDGLIPDASSPAMELGTAFHTACLEGPDVFDERYEISDGPINARTSRPFGRDTKAYREWADGVKAAGHRPLCQEDADTIDRMLSAIDGHALVPDLLSCGKPEVVVRAEASFAGHVLQLQSRIDWLRDNGMIVDVKTCEDLGTIRPDSRLCQFLRDAERFDYVFQMGFYAMMCERETGRVHDAAIIAVEKKPPHEVGVFMLTRATMAEARADVTATLEAFARCSSSDTWASQFANAIML